jgi:hypothetical protein
MKLCRHCNKEYKHAYRNMDSKRWPPKYECSECRKPEWFYRVRETGTQLSLQGAEKELKRS